MSREENPSSQIIESVLIIVSAGVCGSLIFTAISRLLTMYPQAAFAIASSAAWICIILAQGVVVKSRAGREPAYLWIAGGLLGLALAQTATFAPWVIFENTGTAIHTLVIDESAAAADGLGAFSIPIPYIYTLTFSIFFSRRYIKTMHGMPWLSAGLCLLLSITGVSLKSDYFSIYIWITYGPLFAWALVKSFNKMPQEAKYRTRADINASRMAFVMVVYFVVMATPIGDWLYMIDVQQFGFDWFITMFVLANITVSCIAAGSETAQTFFGGTGYSTTTSPVCPKCRAQIQAGTMPVERDQRFSCPECGTRLYPGIWE